jgi:hypothetical protein
MHAAEQADEEHGEESAVGHREKVGAGGEYGAGGTAPRASDDLGIAHPLAVGAQVAVEGHGDGAHQQAAARLDGDPLLVD